MRTTKAVALDIDGTLTTEALGLPAKELAELNRASHLHSNGGN